MCTEPTDTLMAHHLATAIERFAARSPMAGCTSYRARPGLTIYRARPGLTIATLASTVRPELATQLLGQIADEVIDAADGYAAREALGFREPIEGITEHQHGNLSRLVAESGLGLGTLPRPTRQRLTTAADDAMTVEK
jgi:hypothetical protein